MYCPTCGVAVTQGLGYCKHCGAKLGGAGDAVGESSEVKSETLISAMAAVFILGLMTITVLMGVMKAVLGFNVGQIIAFAMLAFLTMLLLEGVFIRLLFRSKRGSQEPGDTVQLKGQATKELDAAPQRVLAEPLPSVTEHTTRAFDPIYNERTPK